MTSIERVILACGPRGPQLRTITNAMEELYQLLRAIEHRQNELDARLRAIEEPAASRRLRARPQTMIA